MFKRPNHPITAILISNLLHITHSEPGSRIVMGDQVLQATKRTGQSQPSAPRVRLTCEACCQRKVKCDKLSPCTSCQRLGLVCVPVERARLPRGRAQKTAERALGSDKELSDRVAKLEQLLQKFATERGSDSPQAPTVTDQRCNIVEQVSDAETKKADVGTWRNQVALSNLNLPHGPRRSTTYVGSSFWEDIMQQVRLPRPPNYTHVIETYLAVTRLKSYAAFWSIVSKPTIRISKIHLALDFLDLIAVLMILDRGPSSCTPVSLPLAWCLWVGSQLLLTVWGQASRSPQCRTVERLTEKPSRGHS